MAVTLRELTGDNRAAVLALRVAPDQERFVGGSVQDALDDAGEYPQAKPWYRVIYADNEPVGFVMVSWDVEPQPPEIIGPWFLWKLLIDQRYQGRGYGSEAVRQVAGAGPGRGGERAADKLCAAGRWAGGLLPAARVCADRCAGRQRRGDRALPAGLGAAAMAVVISTRGFVVDL